MPQYHGKRCFEAHREPIDATMSYEPDPAWVFVDTNGHEHRWRIQSSLEADLPTLDYITVREPIEGDEYDLGEHEYRCKECQEVIDPKTRASTVRKFVPGLLELFIDGEPVDKEAFEREFMLDHGRSPWGTPGGRNEL